MTYCKAAIVTAIIGLFAVLPVIADSENKPGQWARSWICEFILQSTLELYQKDSTGKVVLDGIEVYTDYRVEGLTRKWLWGLTDNIYQYEVALDGHNARYYAFDGAIGRMRVKDDFVGCQ